MFKQAHACENKQSGSLGEIRCKIHKTLAGYSRARDASPQAGNGMVITMIVEFAAHFVQTCAISHRAEEFEIRVEVSLIEPPL